MAEPASAVVDEPIRFGTATARWVLLASILGSGLAGIDATVVNVALPAIGGDLDAEFAQLQWVVTAYTLTLASFILLGGALGDRFGRRRVFVIGVAWFAVASLLCGLAPSVGWLIAARAVQGVGGALLTPGSLAMIQASFAQQDRARAIGPFVGGWLIGFASWRWVFLINAPLAVVVVLVAQRHVPETSDPTAAGRVDLVGAALGAVGLGGITFAIIEAPAGVADAAVITSAIVGVAAMVGFLAWERLASHPMLPLSIFGSRQFSAANTVTFFIYAAFAGFFFLLVVQLQVAGFSPLAAGTALLLVTVLMLIGSPRAGQLAQRIGPRLPMTLGPLVCAVAGLLMLRIGPDADYVTDVLPPAVVLGLGLTILVATLTATVPAAVENRQAGIASGVNNAVARAAGLLAVAALPVLAGITGVGLLLVGAALAAATISNEMLAADVAAARDRAVPPAPSLRGRGTSAQRQAHLGSVDEARTRGRVPHNGPRAHRDCYSTTLDCYFDRRAVTTAECATALEPLVRVRGE